MARESWARSACRSACVRNAMPRDGSPRATARRPCIRHRSDRPRRIRPARARPADARGPRPPAGGRPAGARPRQARTGSGSGPRGAARAACSARTSRDDGFGPVPLFQSVDGPLVEVRHAARSIPGIQPTWVASVSSVGRVRANLAESGEPVCAGFCIPASRTGNSAPSTRGCGLSSTTSQATTLAPLDGGAQQREGSRTRTARLVRGSRSPA